MSRATGKLVAFLSMLAATLSIGLAGDRRVAAVFAADASRGQHDVDRAEHVLHAMAVMFDAAGVHQKTGFRRSPPFGGLADRRSAMPVTSAVRAASILALLRPVHQSRRYAVR